MNKLCFFCKKPLKDEYYINWMIKKKVCLSCGDEETTHFYDMQLFKKIDKNIQFIKNYTRKDAKTN